MKKSQLKQLIKEVIQESIGEKKSSLIEKAKKMTQKMELICWREYGIPIKPEKEKKVEREKLKKEILSRSEYNQKISKSSLLKEIKEFSIK